MLRTAHMVEVLNKTVIETSMKNSKIRHIVQYLQIGIRIFNFLEIQMHM
jgi:hypothetical protein